MYNIPSFFIAAVLLISMTTAMWLGIATGDGHAAIDESAPEQVSWTDERGVLRFATVPKVVFARQ